MKKKLLYSIVLIVAALFGAASNCQAQQKADANWLKEVRDYKHDLLAQEMNLSDDQKAKFFPLYSAMEDETVKINREARELEMKLSKTKSASDSEYAKVAEALVDAKAKEAEVEQRYYEKFKTVLTPKQLFLLKKAESKFARTMLTHSKQRSKK